MNENSYLAKHKKDVPHTDNDPISGHHGEFFETEDEAIESLPESN